MKNLSPQIRILVQSLRKNELWRARSVLQRNGTQWLQKERQYSESHKSIFILNKNWTNMRARAGNSPRFQNVRSFGWLRTDWFCPRSSTLLMSVSSRVTWHLAGWLARRQWLSATSPKNIEEVVKTSLGKICASN